MTITMPVHTASSARLTNHLLGGNDWYEADQHLAHRLSERSPRFSNAVLINAAHGHATVRTMVRELGIRPILDLGTATTSGQIGGAA